jgi:hypothetical protein
MAFWIRSIFSGHRDRRLFSVRLFFVHLFISGLCRRHFNGPCHSVLFFTTPFRRFGLDFLWTSALRCFALFEASTHPHGFELASQGSGEEMGHALYLGFGTAVGVVVAGLDS